MASASPPGPDISIAPTLIGVTATLHALTWVTFAARIRTRVRPALRLGWDDYFIAAAVVFDLVSWSTLMVATAYGVGRHNYYVSAPNRMEAEKFLFISQPAFSLSLACIKISIMCMLLRLQSSFRMGAFLYIMIAIQVLTAITTLVFQFMLCKPLPAVWDRSIENPTCIVAEIYVCIMTTSVVTIVTDVILSLLPLTFIVRLHLPLREKIALACLMGLGLVASASSICKTIFAKNYDVRGDTLRDSVPVALCSMVELQLGILAACIPCLKRFLESFLRHIGVLISSHPSHGGYASQDNRAHFELYKLQNDTEDTRKYGLTATQSEERILSSTSLSALEMGACNIVKTTEISCTSATTKEQTSK